jgi:hypothetical protein
MKSKKWFVLVLVIVFAAALVVGCGGGGTADPAPNNNNNNNDVDNSTPAEGPTFSHATDGAFADCVTCHKELEEGHANFANYEDNCLDCHEQV